MRKATEYMSTGLFHLVINRQTSELEDFVVINKSTLLIITFLPKLCLRLFAGLLIIKVKI